MPKIPPEWNKREWISKQHPSSSPWQPVIKLFQYAELTQLSPSANIHSERQQTEEEEVELWKKQDETLKERWTDVDIWD